MAAAVLVGGRTTADAQQRPVYQQERYEEDWSFLRDATARQDPWDGLKYVPLRRPEWFLTMAGEARDRYERLDHPGFGAGAEDLTGYLLQRYLFSADVHLGRRWRVFAELQSGLEHGRAGGPGLTDVNRLDLGQGFIDLSASTGALAWRLRLGRQEIAFGTGRLISPGEGLNVRRSFDGGRLTARLRAWEYNAMLVKPATVAAGIFDDRATRGQVFWGAGVIGPHPVWPRARFSAYYLGLDKDRAVFVQGSGPQRRHTVGSRSWIMTSRWDANLEGIVQWGRFSGAPILAGALSADVGHMWPGRWRPRVGIRGDLITGDADPRDPRLQTFDPLFPSATAYSGSSGLIGASNIVDVTPTIRVSPHRRLTIAAESAWYWRHRTTDGVYTIFVTPLRPALVGAPRRVGVAPGVAVNWQLDAHAALSTAVSRFEPGPFLRATTASRAVNYVMTSVAYRF